MLGRLGKRKTLAYQIKEVLSSKLALGQSKHYDKVSNSYVVKDKIYSLGTLKSYMKHANYFASWAKKEYGVKTLEEARPLVDKYLEARINQGLSPYTIKLEASALAKLYGVSAKEFLPTPSRHRADITRSRGKKVRDSHFSEEKNWELVEFCRSTGLRRRELSKLTGDKLLERDGRLFILVDRGSKGGRVREAPVIRNVELVREKMLAAGTGKVFPKITGNADIHSYRREYATELYRLLARPIEDIPYDAVNRGSGGRYQSEVYFCKGDLKGVKLDKRALSEVSQALGHNRISVVAAHYVDY